MLPHRTIDVLATCYTIFLDTTTSFIDNTHHMSEVPLDANDLKWYAVKVRSKNELKVSKIFSERLGIKTSVPCQKVWKRADGLKKVSVRPLLSTYVLFFANIDNINWRLFFSPPGVFGVVRQNGVPAEIPVDQIESLMTLASSDEPIYDIPYAELTSNQRVEVVRGPLVGAVGHFIKVSKDAGRFIVSLDLFKRALVTELDADLVRPC